MNWLSQSKVKSLLSWLDDNILLVLAGFLIAFIPLYPKIPLWSPIEQYIVRVRLEDVFVLFTGFVWLVQVIRGKVQWKTPFFWLVLAYAIVGLLSMISAMFVIKSIPLQPLHVGKTVLHYFRYLEYFSLLMIVFSAVKKRSHVLTLTIIMTLTVLAITAYGFGQKYFYFPVYSTMNREFSKGIRLYLTPHARVQSTFAGHYDMAAYLVIALPIILALAYISHSKKSKLFFYSTFWIGSWLLIISASRASFGAFLLGVAVVVSLVALQQQTWGKKISYGISRGLLLFLGLGIIFATFGGDLNERLGQVIEKNPVWHDTFHSWNKQRKEFLASIQGNGPQMAPPENAISTDEAIELGVLTPTDERPVTSKPSDVYVDVPDIKTVATVSATGEVTHIQVNNGPRTYSDCALKHGLSLCIRLDTLWPRALNGFKRNPLLGTGYATLNKETDDQFTEAESTDNNFLRTLGETGALGVITFYGSVVVGLWYSILGLRKPDWLLKALSIGFIGGTIGLLLNAVYIDVFAASKVAFTYWGLLGLIMGYMASQKVTPVVADSLTTSTAEVSDSSFSSKSPKKKVKTKRRS